MKEERITRQEIAQYLSKHTRLSAAVTVGLVNTMIESLTQALIQGEEIKITRFGHFFIKKKKQRSGRNPKTKQEHTIEERYVCIFHASQGLKARVKAGNIIENREKI